MRFKIEAGLMVPAFFIIMVLGGCGTSPGNLVLLTWNVQNLFDGTSQGGEYREFDPQFGEWNTHKYQARLESIARVIASVGTGGPDIMILEELENQGVLDDLLGTWLATKGYKVGHWIGLNKAGPGIGFVSRFPVHELRVHGLHWDGQPLRPLVEAHISTPHGNLVVFGCHWKSRREGLGETEGPRILAANTIAYRAQELRSMDPKITMVVMGDLNTYLDLDQDKFGLQGMPPWLHSLGLQGLEVAVPHGVDPGSADTGPRALVPPSGGATIIGWQDLGEGLEPGGTYWYQGRWDFLDHILVHDGTGVFDFHPWVPMEPGLLDGQGRPWGYEPRLARGISDHLPLATRLAW